MGKINLSKPTFLILFLVVAGIGLTIGAASAVVVFTENLQVDNGAGDSEVEITSATGNSKLTLTDQGKKEYAIINQDGKKKLLVKDVSKNKIRLVLKNNGNLEVKKNIIAGNYFDKGNTQTGTNAIALGGNDNAASGSRSTVGGGSNNIASLAFSTVGGGDSNEASGSRSTVGGGGANGATGFASTVGGGTTNVASGTRSTIGGGDFNTAPGFDSTVPGGEKNEASGKYSFAAGRKAKALFDGDIVFADSNNFDFSSTAANQFFVRAIGGTTLVSGIDGAGAATFGVVLASGSDSWAGISDNRFKDNISEFSVLDKLDSYRAVEFDWRSSGIHDVGVIGQELEQVFPELVNSGSNDGDVTSITDPGVWSVEYSKLGALALQAIKEQQTIIDSLISIICEDNPDREICLEN